MKDYDTETAQKRIEMLCTQKGMKPTIVARESGVGTNSIANLKRGSMLSADKLAKIADYLECSVDYLLGRTDDPANTSIIKTGDINSSSNIRNNNSISISAMAEAENEISSILSGLKPREANGADDDDLSVC